VRADIYSQSSYLGIGQFRLFRILQQPVFSIDSQYDVEDSQRQRRHRVYSGCAPIIAVFEASLSIKFKSFLSRYSSCFNAGFSYGDSQTNQACTRWTRRVKYVSNDQSTEQSLAVSHDAQRALQAQGKYCGLRSGNTL
jgi:hypothetical protein